MHDAALWQLLALQRAALGDGQWWRLWSGHLMHLDARHALLNIAALLLLAWLAARARQLRALLGMSVLLMPLLSLILLASLPTLDWYVGLSGLLHGWAAWLLLQHRGPWPLAGLAGLAALAAKLGWEAIATPSTAAAWPVVSEAHLIGALLGALLALPARISPRHRL